MDSPNLNIALRIKTNSVRGGVVERIFMRDVTIGQVSQAVVTVDFQYEEGDTGKFPPTVRDVEVRNVTSQKSRNALSLRGYSYAPVTNVRLQDCRFENVAQPDILEHVKDLRFENVRLNGVVRNETVVELSHEETTKKSFHTVARSHGDARGCGHSIGRRHSRMHSWLKNRRLVPVLL
jgi:hypothetical protein